MSLTERRSNCDAAVDNEVALRAERADLERAGAELFSKLVDDANGNAVAVAAVAAVAVNEAAPTERLLLADDGRGVCIESDGASFGGACSS